MAVGLISHRRFFYLAENLFAEMLPRFPARRAVIFTDGQIDNRSLNKFLGPRTTIMPMAQIRHGALFDAGSPLFYQTLTAKKHRD